MNSQFPLAYAAYNLNLDVRLTSTSGGIFTLFATYFLEHMRAVVYGAAFDESFEVRHIRIENTADISRLRGSKYPQSKMGDAFLHVQEDLTNGRVVFFVGTPCQIAALHNYLRGRYRDQLYCMDFVCHGVASDAVWRSYVEHLSSKHDLAEIVFKSKPKGWKKWYFYAAYQNGSSFKVRGKMNLFMRSYLSYCNIRPSCYECHFKGLVRESDFTISDCWGIGEQNVEMNDNRGLSALLIQNERAQYVFEKIKDQIKYQQYDPDELMSGNWTAYSCIKTNPDRPGFFADVLLFDGYTALVRHFRPTLRNWIRYYIDRIKGTER